ncbi:hypothetical protein KI387_023074, partial [Taxus chinensis]
KELEYDKLLLLSDGAKEMVGKLLDPDPLKRVSMAQIIEDPWFAKGFRAEVEDNTVEVPRGKADEYSKLVPEKDSIESLIGEMKPKSLNAIEIINLMSFGLDLSTWISNYDNAKENSNLCFTSMQPVHIIVNVFEKIGKDGKFKINKIHCAVNMKRKEAGKKGHLGIKAKISEIGPSLFAVTVSKEDGDTVEYKNFCDQELKPTLKDIAWVWHGGD